MFKDFRRSELLYKLLSYSLKILLFPAPLFSSHLFSPLFSRVDTYTQKSVVNCLKLTYTVEVFVIQVFVLVIMPTFPKCRCMLLLSDLWEARDMRNVALNWGLIWWYKWTGLIRWWLQWKFNDSVWVQLQWSSVTRSIVPVNAMQFAVHTDLRFEAWVEICGRA